MWNISLGFYGKRLLHNLNQFVNTKRNMIQFWFDTVVLSALFVLSHRLFGIRKSGVESQYCKPVFWQFVAFLFCSKYNLLWILTEAAWLWITDVSPNYQMKVISRSCKMSSLWMMCTVCLMNRCAIIIYVIMIAF